MAALISIASRPSAILAPAPLTARPARRRCDGTTGPGARGAHRIHWVPPIVAAPAVTAPAAAAAPAAPAAPANKGVSSAHRRIKRPRARRSCEPCQSRRTGRQHAQASPGMISGSLGGNAVRRGQVEKDLARQPTATGGGRAARIKQSKRPMRKSARALVGIPRHRQLSLLARSGNGPPRRLALSTRMNSSHASRPHWR